jgi:hypothetical protein
MVGGDDAAVDREHGGSASMAPAAPNMMATIDLIDDTAS